MGTSGTTGAKGDDGQDKTGPEGTIPESEDGISASSTGEPSNFEPEEDEGADEAK